MARMTGGKAVIEALRANGADAVFGIPGVHNVLMYDPLKDSGIRHYVTRHEQGAGFMADGYARITGRPGVTLPITGPGLTNISTPVAQAWTDSAPMLVISSQVESTICDRQKGTLHELRDQMGFMAQITDWNARVTSPEDCVAQIGRAYHYLASNRPRPIHIEVPMDVQSCEAEVTVAPGAPASPKAPCSCQVEVAARVLHGKARPVIFAGGGAVISGAGEQILRLSRLLGAPILTTCQGKGVVPEDHPYVIGNFVTEPKVQEYLATCDATVAIGTHFGASDTNSWKAHLPTPLIHIDIDSSEFGKNYEATAVINGDARLSVEALCDVLSPTSSGCESAAKIGGALREECMALALQRIPWEYSYLQAIRRGLGRDGVLVCDMTTMCYPATRYFPVYEPRTFMFPRGFGTLGFSPPVAIGAKIGCAEKKVVAIVGDGGFQFTCQDLATAVQYNIPVVIVLVNSSSYETVKRHQAQRFGVGRETDVDLVNPDFMKLADAYGVGAWKVDDVCQFEKALESAFLVSGPVIIEVPHKR